MINTVLTRVLQTFGAAALACAACAPLAGPAFGAEGIPKTNQSASDFRIDASGNASRAIVSTHDLLVRLNQPWVQLIDVRSGDEYTGRDIRALRGGHIPGARSIPLAGADPVAIEAGLGPHLGVLDPRKETILYGQDAADAAPVAAWLEAHGFRHVRLYTDAWRTWGNALELPAADERFADVSALHDRIAELQQAVQRLSLARLAGK